ncbi:MAG: ribonuclease BN [Micrococcales bacterium 73-15]|uniref:YihY/virulence factor BrkB family protein n=1 Tax=Salana multivorans TaxID=120377 RepID=UPI0009683DDD|nr:YihY/virulence factor BrkB family protein [Salana multivorans]OJX97864.1 MAG: ribonuclease BN [Micrococcales bacterium 73-15]
MKAWVATVVERVQAVVAWFNRTRVGRMNARYGAVNGALLAGGIAYAGLFSTFAVLTLAFTVFMRLLGDNVELRDAVVDAIDRALPGIIKNGGNDGLLTPDQLILDSGLTVTSVVAVVTLLLSGLAVMGSLGMAVRAMFGVVAPAGNAVVAKLRDLSGFVVLALAVLVTAALTVAAGTAGAWVTAQLGLEAGVGALLVRGLGLLGAFVVDTLVFAAIMRLLAGARPPTRDLWAGAMMGAAIGGLVRLLGTSVVGGARGNPLLASFAALVTLLLWINLVARITLYVAAWTANPPAPEHSSVRPEELHARQRPNYVTVSVPATLTWDHDPRTGAVLPSEATRVEREDTERERTLQRRELQAALDAALERPDSWWSRRRALRAARRAARDVRADRAEDQRPD